MEMRAATEYVANNLKGKLIAAEVGVRAGNHAEAMLDKLDLKRMYLIDSYRPYMDGGNFIETKQQMNWCKEMLEKLDKYNDKTTILSLSSHDVSKIIPDDHFDYIYIDACHEYDLVKEDIEDWYPKIKIGGIIAGHDYMTSWPGVKIAVDEFANSNNYKLIEPGGCDWLIIKT